MPIKCCRCDGLIVFGEPRVMNCNGELTHWCTECAEAYADAVWNEEWGPRESMAIALASEARN